MSERLWSRIQEVLIKEGAGAHDRLGLAVGRDPETVARWIRTKRVPSANAAYLLAKAAGAPELEATDIGKEVLASEDARDTA